MKQTVYNFAAGPAMLPAAVLRQAKAKLIDYRGAGVSIMEMSHRGKIFSDVIARAEASLRNLMEIPDHYRVLFVQGGASTQFAAVPLNLFHHSHQADFLDTGVWASKAIKEANRFGKARVVASSRDKNYTYIPETQNSDFDPKADYLHITTNNTIYGTRLPYLPGRPGVPVVADMSSNILSEVYKVSDFGLIYAGAQKNIGPAGLTIVIVRDDLLGHASAQCPTMLNYQTHVDKGSMYNTPPTFAIYLAGLVFDWVLEQGGVPAMQQRNVAKAKCLYDYLDQSDYYQANIQGPERSLMNITFSLKDKEQEARFVAEAEANGLQALKGHRSVGGIRASVYNAMPLEGVQALVDFMDQFTHAT